MTLDHQIIEVFDKGAKNIAAEQARTECEEHEEKIRQKKTKHINALKSYAAELIRALRIEPLTFKDYNGELIELEEWRRFASSSIADDYNPAVILESVREIAPGLRPAIHICASDNYPQRETHYMIDGSYRKRFDLTSQCSPFYFLRSDEVEPGVIRFNKGTKPEQTARRMKEGTLAPYIRNLLAMRNAIIERVDYEEKCTGLLRRVLAHAAQGTARVNERDMASHKGWVYARGDNGCSVYVQGFSDGTVGMNMRSVREEDAKIILALVTGRKVAVGKGGAA